MGRIDAALYLPFIWLNLLQSIKRQRKFLDTHIVKDLEKFRLENDQSLDDNDFKKITEYYGLGVPAVLGESFCILRGKEMTPEERMVSTCQGAMTGLFDDFFDKKDISLSEIVGMIDNPYKYNGINSNEKLFLHFYRKLLENSESVDCVKKFLFDVYEAQVSSKKQTIPLIPEEEIQNITFQKGGVSMLFYRCVFQHSMNLRERDMLFCLGGLMQLGNDIFDVYKDSMSGIQTMVTATKKIQNVRLLFMNRRDECFSLVDKTFYPKERKDQFKRFISLGLSRCFVCLDQLEALEIKTENVFTPSVYSRNELICDMEKVSNIIKSVKYYLTLK